MFDVGNVDMDCDGANEPVETKRRQYTLKGIEADTIRLMRDAANVEGMKIGSWVSIRMKEAAERALSDGKSTPVNNPADVVGQPQVDLVGALMKAIDSYREEANARFTRLERELHDLGSGQRAILTNLLNSK